MIVSPTFAAAYAFANVAYPLPLIDATANPVTVYNPSITSTAYPSLFNNSANSSLDVTTVESFP